MKGGKLRKRITFEQPTSTQDSYGQDIQTWEEVATVWAAVEPIRGTNLQLSGASTIVQEGTHRITCRFNSALVGQIKYRIRLGETFSFFNLTSDQFCGMDNNEFGNMVSSTTPCRYFRISQIQDENERHRELDIVATELVN
jgi:SPP1 family predicted phage head-tail adaptor